MDVALMGCGKMGRAVEAEAKSRGHAITCRIDSTSDPEEWRALKISDVAIHFSHPDVVLQHTKTALKLHKPIVLGTTGWDGSRELVKEWVTHYDGGLVFSPNFSLGMNLFHRMAQQAGRLMSSFSQYDVAIAETHHSQKVDAPSGTALALENSLNKTLKRGHAIPVTSLRVGHNPGTHQVVFDSPEDTITLTHQARNRQGFALGAVLAAEWIRKRKGFFSFHEVMDSLLEEVYHGTPH